MHLRLLINRQFYKILAIFTVVGLIISVTLNYVKDNGSNTVVERESKVVSDWWDKQPLQLKINSELALELMELYVDLEQLYNTKQPPHLEHLNRLESLAKDVFPPLDMATDISTTDPVSCPDYHDDQTSDKSWFIANCNTPKSFGDLVTVVMSSVDIPAVDVKKASLQLLEDFQTSYPGVTIIVIGSQLGRDSITRLNGSRIILMSVDKHKLPYQAGPMWNSAFRQVNTPYVLVARDMLRFSNMSSPLDRLIRVLSEMPGVGAVGGAVRNMTGHWKTGCFQTELKNYVLKYKKGYHFSRNGSMFCDYVDGPFLALTSLLKSVPLTKSLHSAVVFQDFFLRLSEDWLSMLCPDVMFYANALMADSGKNIVDRTTWVAMAQKWELNRILTECPLYHILHKYSCADIGISCGVKMAETRSFTLPVCCQENLANALKFWYNFTATYKLFNYFDSGTCLGAVKMEDILAWDVDVDATYDQKNHTFIKRQYMMLEKNGLKLVTLPPWYLTKYLIKFLVFGMDVEMWGESFVWRFSRNDTPVWVSGHPQAPISFFTKMNVHGAWVNGPHNPGRYARNRYGRECLRHGQHWSQTGESDSWQPYVPGNFLLCLTPGHHACLQSFSTDGNIDYYIPQW